MSNYWPDPSGDRYDDDDSMRERGATAPLTGEGYVEPDEDPDAERERALDDDADAYFDRASDPND